MPLTSTLRRLSVVPLLFLLAACAPTTPPDATPETPSETTPATSQPPAPMIAALIEVDAAGLTVLTEDGVEMASIPFDSDPAVGAETLGNAIGEDPFIEEFTESGECQVPHTSASWGDVMSLTWGPEAGIPAPAQMRFFANSPTTPSGVAIATPAGVTVGDTLADWEAADPSVEPLDASGSGTYFYDVRDGATDDEDFGVRFDTDLDTGAAVVLINGPSYLYAGC